LGGAKDTWPVKSPISLIPRDSLPVEDMRGTIISISKEGRRHSCTR